jgi:hypothetical protein
LGSACGHTQRIPSTQGHGLIRLSVLRFSGKSPNLPFTSQRRPQEENIFVKVGLSLPHGRSVTSLLVPKGFMKFLEFLCFWGFYELGFRQRGQPKSAKGRLKKNLGASAIPTKPAISRRLILRKAGWALREGKKVTVLLQKGWARVPVSSARQGREGQRGVVKVRGAGASSGSTEQKFGGLTAFQVT